ncbi:hypothetical protein B0H13DRAFT_2320349 [Mycena leptocephala]|nr:hypothetical protein B0H13DRAFT_2320349 [Mycena leptocephala]
MSLMLSGSWGISLGHALDPGLLFCVHHSHHPLLLPPCTLSTSPQCVSTSATGTHVNLPPHLSLLAVRLALSAPPILALCSIKPFCITAMPICRALSSSRAFAPHLRATLPRCLRILQQVPLDLHITSLIHFTSSTDLHSCSPATPPASALPCCLVPALHTTNVFTARTPPPSIPPSLCQRCNKMSMPSCASPPLPPTTSTHPRFILVLVTYRATCTLPLLPTLALSP